MSIFTSPRTSGGQEHEPVPDRAQQKARALGLTSATGLVVGSIVGTGVFAMPAVLASAGTSSLLVLAVIALGATLLALLFGQLTKRVPNSVMRIVAALGGNALPSRHPHRPGLGQGPAPIRYNPSPARP